MKEIGANAESFLWPAACRSGLPLTCRYSDSRIQSGKNVKEIVKRFTKTLHTPCPGPICRPELPLLSKRPKRRLTFDQILNEAKRRGFEAFVATRPISEGFWLLENDDGSVVFYLERDVRMYHEEFEQLEPAFQYWLDQDLRSHFLLGKLSS